MKRTDRSNMFQCCEAKCFANPWASYCLQACHADHCTTVPRELAQLVCASCLSLACYFCSKSAAHCRTTMAGAVNSRCRLYFFILALFELVNALPEQVGVSEALTSDDECVSLDGCELSAMQRRSVTSRREEPPAARAPESPSPSACASGRQIPFSDRGPGNECFASNLGDECEYTCNDGYIGVGRHVCQTIFIENEAGFSPDTPGMMNMVQWYSMMCLQAFNSTALVEGYNGTGIPFLMDSNGHCQAIMWPEAADGYYPFNEEITADWIATEVCFQKNQIPCSRPAMIDMWKRVIGRASHPNIKIDGYDVLSDWAAYVVQIPYYTVNVVNSNPVFQQMLQWLQSKRTELHQSKHQKTPGDSTVGFEMCFGRFPV
eukprot:Skav234345  [mRNA]  locus=scaffold1274:8661:14006:+ [translate_table: standard]